MRLTKDAVEKILRDHEEYRREARYKSRDLVQNYLYLIKDGVLTINGDNKSEVCDLGQTRRFVHRFLV